MYYLGMTYTEAYNIPIWQRFWFIERINKEISKSNGESKAHQDPQERAMTGKGRQQVPGRLRRFT